MFDTGATRDANAFPIRQTVEGLMTNFYAANRSNIDLIVAHSHGHGDHVAGDGQFQGQDLTTVVGVSQADVAMFFGVVNWPEDQV